MILVVDDLDDHRDLLQQVLEESGYPVAGAKDGAEALRLIREIPALVLILLDLRMPGMGGEEFLRTLRADPDAARAGVPVVLMSGIAAEASERLAPLGVAAVLGKPFDLGELRRIVVRFCGPGSPRHGRTGSHPPA